MEHHTEPISTFNHFIALNSLQPFVDPDLGKFPTECYLRINPLVFPIVFFGANSLEVIEFF